MPSGIPPVYQAIVTVSTTPGSSAQGTTILVPGAPSVSTLRNAVLVTTQFSRYLRSGTTSSSPSANGSSTFLTGTDYLFYKVPQ